MEFLTVILISRFVKVIQVSINKRKYFAIRLSYESAKLFNENFNTKLDSLKFYLINCKVKKHEEIFMAVERVKFIEFIQANKSVYNLHSFKDSIIDNKLKIVNNKDLFVSFIEKLESIEVENKKTIDS